MVPVEPEPSNITSSLGLALLINSANFASTSPVGGGGGGGVVVPLSFTVIKQVLISSALI